ncbi:MAG: PQQ-dependent sugar dehydrogenase, partial [Acidobacteria bacterium]|nr:PQQ-dependent sugar dehydrogenase [Acidobacteriota bacterium]
MMRPRSLRRRSSAPARHATRPPGRATALLAATLLALVAPAAVEAQEDAPQPESFAAEGIPPVPLPDGPREYDTATGQRIRVVVVAEGLTYPWGLAFLPDESILVTERLGTLRRIRGGALDSNPIAGVPEVYSEAPLAGLMDVAVHPEFGDNGFVYLTYSKPVGDS